VVEVDLDKNDAWVKANNWMVKTFVSSESVIEFSDKEAGVINGKYNLTTIVGGSQSGYTNSINASVFIQCKDNTVKITVDPQDYNTFSSKSGSLYKAYMYPREDALASVNALIADFENYMINDKSLEDF
jgi:hypothetical protein